jgi:hypothetical protein
MMRTLTRLTIAVLVTCSLLPISPTRADQTGDRRLFSPHSQPFGRAYAEWFAEYQEWLNEIPTPMNPVTDPTSPENCDVEDGRVTFVVAGADCRVPEHKAVAFSDAFWECSTAEGLGDSYPELRACAVDNFAADFNRDVLEFSIRVDGQTIRRPRRWTVLTPIPSDLIDFPKDNIWGAEPGPSKSVTKGFFYILRPLPEGAHTITVDVHHETFGDFTLTYEIRVV